MKSKLPVLCCHVLLLLLSASSIGWAKLGEKEAACRKEAALETRGTLVFSFGKDGLAESLTLIAKADGEVIEITWMEELIFKNYDFDYFEFHMGKNGDSEIVHDGKVFGFYKSASTNRPGRFILNQNPSTEPVEGRRVIRFDRPK